MSSDGLSALADGASSHSGSGDESVAGSEGDMDEEVGRAGTGAAGFASGSASDSDANDMGGVDEDAQAGGSGSEGDGVSEERAAGPAGGSALVRDSRGEGGQSGPSDKRRAGGSLLRAAAVGAYVPPAARAPGAHCGPARPLLGYGPQCQLRTGVFQWYPTAPGGRGAVADLGACDLAMLTSGWLRSGRAGGGRAPGPPRDRPAEPPGGGQRGGGGGRAGRAVRVGRARRGRRGRHVRAAAGATSYRHNRVLWMRPAHQFAASCPQAKKR